MKAIRVIRDEHRTISAVLHALKQLAQEAEHGGKPAFPALRAMIRFIDECPEKLHHPKEDALMKKLLARDASAAPLVESLAKEHAEGERLIREVERALVFFEDRAPAGAKAFLDTVSAYAEFHWKHMRKEEQELLPLAERHLTAADWSDIDGAFGANPSFERQFLRIVDLAPAPVGLGPAA
jgi:hemerythrin-like domain-containing protein